MTVNKRNIKKELLNEIRNADLISTTERGVTTTTQEFNGDNSTVAFILTGTGSGDGGIKNIRTITVDAVTKDFGTDWTMSDDFQTITFTTAPPGGTDNVDIQYDYSVSGDRIYPDFPKTSISNTKFPRIGFDILSMSTDVIEVSGNRFQSSVLISLVSYQTGANETEDLNDSLRNFLLTKRLSWYYLNFLRPSAEGPLLIIDGTNDKIFQRNTDFIAQFEFESP